MFASFYVIPFFLVAYLPSPPHSNDSSPEFTFEARVTTTIFHNDQAHNGMHLSSYFFKLLEPLRPTMNKHVMTIELKCRTYEMNALMCHKGRHEQYPRTARNLVKFSDGYQKTRFQVKFNENGVTGYAVEKASNDSMEFLLNLYRFFGSQLNIGTEVAFEGDSSFQSTEQSIIGTCPTQFDIKHQKNNLENATLEENASLSLIYYIFKRNEMIRISKQRHIQDCQMKSNYMFGSSFWSELFPDGTEKNIISSQSVLTLSKYNFESKTQNVFNLHDRNQKVIGGAVESIEVVLKSILPPKDFPSRIFLRPILGGVVARRRNRK